MPTVLFTSALQRFCPRPRRRWRARRSARRSPRCSRRSRGCAAMCSTTRARCAGMSRSMSTAGRSSDRIGLTDPVGPQDEIYVFQALSGG